MLLSYQISLYTFATLRLKYKCMCTQTLNYFHVIIIPLCAVPFKVQLKLIEIMSECCRIWSRCLTPLDRNPFGWKYNTVIPSIDLCYPTCHSQGFYDKVRVVGHSRPWWCRRMCIFFFISFLEKSFVSVCLPFSNISFKPSQPKARHTTHKWLDYL